MLYFTESHVLMMKSLQYIYLCSYLSMVFLQSTESKPANKSDKDHIIDSDKVTTFPLNEHIEKIFNNNNRPIRTIDYSNFLDYTHIKAHEHQTKQAVKSAVLQSSYTDKKVDRQQCSNQSLAVIIDLDSDSTLDRDNKALSQQANIDALAALLTTIRKNGITVIWLSKQASSQSSTIIEKLRPMGLLDEKDFLSLRQKKERKQIQRQYVASQYCVISILGDSRSDFDEAFEYLREPDQFIGLNIMFEKGWFLRPIPHIISE